ASSQGTYPADDTMCLLFSGKTWKSVHAKTTYELNKTFFFTFIVNSAILPLNELTIHFFVNNENICNNLNISHTILRIQSVTFNNHLRFNLHINYLINRPRISVHHFYKLHFILPQYRIRIVYLSFYQAVFH
ncbi:putative RNA-directed DNA polymerase, partial [Aphis craccivora]